jgi:hypothetical protein
MSPSIDGAPSALERLGARDETAAALFAVARAYRPPARARRRTLRALGVPLGLSLIGSAVAQAAHALVVTMAATMKGWGLVAGAVAAVGTGGGVAYWASSPRAPAAAVVRAPRADGPAARAIEPVAPSAPQALAPPVVAAEPPAALVRPVVARSRAAVIAAAPVAPSPPPDVAPTVPRPPPDLAAVAPPPFEPAMAPRLPVAPLSPQAPQERGEGEGRGSGARVMASGMAGRARSGLEAELDLIAVAGRRLGSGDARGALVVLERHRGAFPRGALAEEVEVLRISALLAAGEGARARLLGGAFLQTHGTSPLAARVRALIGSGSSTTDSTQGDVP